MRYTFIMVTTKHYGGQSFCFQRENTRISVHRACGGRTNEDEVRQRPLIQGSLTQSVVPPIVCCDRKEQCARD